MAVELLALSKFKLQLLALISETRDLREMERSAREELHLSIQRRRQIEAEYAQKLQELRAELASRDELQHKLETKVKYLENESALMVKKEKELKETVNCLLQSRDNFISTNEDSTYELRRSIEIKDRKVSVLSEKIHAHLLLFHTIEKEAAAVKQVLNSIQHLVNEKEHVVIGLKEKMDKISVFEKDFVEKICFLENKLSECQHELGRRNTTISELKEQLEIQKISSNFQPQVEELRKALLVKEDVIQSLTSEKQALHLELQNLELTLHKIQDFVIYTSTEDQKALSPVLAVQEVCEMISREENESLENIIQSTGEDSPNKKTSRDATENAALSLPEEHTLGNASPCRKHVLGSCLPKPSDCSSPHSICSDPSTSINVLPHISKDGNMGNYTSSVHRLDSESSTTGAEAS